MFKVGDIVKIDFLKISNAIDSTLAQYWHNKVVRIIDIENGDYIVDGLDENGKPRARFGGKTFVKLNEQLLFDFMRE